jgi:hypothetical protein
LSKSQVMARWSANPAAVNDKIVDFEKQVGGVIAMKIHGVNHVTSLRQSLCLLKYAYNERPNYDILVFSTLPVPQEDINSLQAIVAPAKFTLVVDNPGLHEMVHALKPERRDHLLKRCNATKVEELEFYTKCTEGDTFEKIAYTWQAEFRVLHIWKHPALAPYRYMLWIDSDGFCTKKWDKDPMAAMIRNDLALLFANFPQGSSKGFGFQERFVAAFNQTFCYVGLEDGHLYAKSGICKKVKIPQVHGFLHVTNLDFYRSEPVMHWARTLIGDTKFSRMYDDQLGVTMPAAVLAPNRSWYMVEHGINLEVYHNGKLDGKRFSGAGGFVKWWRRNGTSYFPTAHGKCVITESN